MSVPYRGTTLVQKLKNISWPELVENSSDDNTKLKSLIESTRPLQESDKLD
jgi:hypothetical protein